MSAGVLSAPAGAAATETVQIGNTLEHSYNFAVGACLGPSCTMVQESAATATLPLRSPVNGVITQWSVRSGQIASLFTLRVLRPAGSLTYTFAGTSVAPTQVQDSMDLVRDYPASLPIQAGDAIGLDAGAGGEPMHSGPPSGIADRVAYHPSAGPDGSTAAFTLDPMAARELLLRATISFCRVPEVKGQESAAAQAAIAAAGCTAGVSTTPLVFVKKKLKSKKKRAKQRAALAQLRAIDGKVASQGTAAGTTVAPGTQVPIVVNQLQILKPKPKKKKKKK